MDRQLHGGDTYGHPSALDFSSNTSPLGLPESVQAALAGSVGDWDGYPDPLCRDLTAAIAAADGVPAAWVHCGNGAADLIFRVAQALRPRRALTLAPTFSEYEYALAAAGCETAFHPLHEKDNFALTDTILGKLSPALDLVMLCNPNNPTGQPADGELLRRILKKCADCKITLVVDECFVPFLDEPEAHTLKGELAAHGNLILLRAFTKLYAMAGLRLGYLLCANPETIEAVCACEPPWNVSLPAQTAGIAALADGEYVSRVREVVKAERKYLAGELQKLGLRVLGSRANYLFFKCNALPRPRRAARTARHPHPSVRQLPGAGRAVLPRGGQDARAERAAGRGAYGDFEGGVGLAKAIMVQGTSSGAGKSLLAAALCRIFRQDGYSVAPFKSQNMALNSFITDEGLEMGRAQVVQAQAAGIAPSVRMNPILLKPSSDTGSQVIVNGEVLGDMERRRIF